MSVQDQIQHLENIVAALSSKINALEATKFATEAARSLQTTFNDGDIAWMLTSTGLVLFMTIPGLALFYGGMARTKNVLAIVMQCFTITALMTFLWLAFGYSLAFAPVVGGNPNDHLIYGNRSRFWLVGMGLNTYHQLAPTIPESVFCAFQLTFAIITPALITGAFADRMKFTSMIVFMTLWHLIVYCPVAHSVWHPDGFLFKAGALDFAGGDVVHINAGVAGLVCAIYLGVRKGYGKESFEPHNILLTAVGSAMLWVGWFGFNAGSAVSANSRAAMALLATQIATGTSTLTWTITEWIVRKKPSVLGTVSGAVAGLVAITPASGFVDQTGAFIIGLLAGPICYGGAQIKHYLGYDDALDAFGVHAIGGIFGGLATGFLATSSIGGVDGVFYADTYTGGRQWAKQLYAITIIALYSAFATFVILFCIDKTMGVRVTEEEEEAGLDHSLHGEKIGEGNNNNNFAPIDIIDKPEKASDLAPADALAIEP